MSDQDVVHRLNAALEGRYRIERQLGEGGMATVYLADDLRHERKVALKVLKPELAAVVGAERFLAEIKTTANLQHPHILPLFDSGEADSFLFYVMPYVNGESLRKRLDREHQLPVDEAVDIARKVAGALQAAHERGVIHRDIKPANILLSNGEPLVSDFGIALAVGAAGGGRLTETGLSLGTPHYMSPEQATGDLSVSATSDIYALGCVLYEMLVGEPPYTASTPQAVLGKIVTGPVPCASEERTSVPTNVDAAIRRALEKVPADRFRNATAIVDALSDAGFRHGPVQVSSGSGYALRPGQAVVLGLMIAVVTLAAAWGWLTPRAPSTPGVPTRTRVLGLDVEGRGPAGGGGRRLAISPDGRWLAAVGIVTNEEGFAETNLYVRSASALEWRRLPGTTSASDPSFSPDGRFLAYTDAGQIFRIPIEGGPTLPIASGGSPHWALDGSIVYTVGQVLYRVASPGSEPERLLEPGGVLVFKPHMLPNGKAVVFATGVASESTICILEIETGEVRQLVPFGSNPRYVPTGHILFGYGEGVAALMSVPFDLETLDVTGTPVVVLPELSVYGGGAAQYDVSQTGTLIYDASSGRDLQGVRTLVEVTLEGEEIPVPVAAGGMDGPRYSPDGSKIAFAIRNPNEELHVYDRITRSNPVFETGYGYPTWSPGGEYLYFAPISPAADSYRRRADASEPATQLWTQSGGEYVNDVGEGDSVLVVRTNVPGGGRDLMLVRLRQGEADFEPFLAAGERIVINGTISPDGLWIAYQSNETGEYRVYVTTFPEVTGIRSGSDGPGAEPVWAPDGRTLYYRDGSRFMAVDVTTDPEFETLTPPRLLFDRPEYAGYANPGPRRNWDIHPDGSRFVMLKTEEQGANASASSEIVLVTNWFEELRELMGDN